MKQPSAKTGNGDSVREEKPAAAAEPAVAQVTWNDAQMRTEYANVVNVLNTREEFSLLFGMNSTWSLTAEHGLEVKLSNRVIVTPYAAKRLQILLAERVADYERRFGPLNLGA